MKTGITNLPLHYGSAPHWLFEKMTMLGREISLVIILEYGVGGYLKKSVSYTHLTLPTNREV